MTADGHFAGFELTNNGDSSNFILTADKFQIINGIDEISPFQVEGGIVKLSNATVTGELDITSNTVGEGSMSIKNETIVIKDASERPRVILGKLS